MRLDLSLLALAAPLTVLAGTVHHPHAHRRNHHELSKRADASVQLHKRFSNTRWTFYDVGGAAGACGKFNTPDEHIVALNSAQYGGGYPGPNCWRKIVMTMNGKTTTAIVTDECPGCPYGGLDLTRGLFQFFAPLGVGVLQGDWHFADEGGEEPAPKPSPKSKPKTTYSPPPPPTTHHHTTSTHEEPAPPSTRSIKPTTTPSTPASSSAVVQLPSISVNFSSGVASGLAIPTGGFAPENDEPQNVEACNEMLVNLGGLVYAGAQAD